MNILFVDDEINSGLRELFEEIESVIKQLQPNSNIYKKVNNRLARKFLDENRSKEGGDIDIAFIDSYCPNLNDGEELGEIIHNEFPHIFLVMLTGSAVSLEKVELINRIMRNGFDDFIDKSKLLHHEQKKTVLEHIFSSPKLTEKQRKKKENIYKLMDKKAFTDYIKEDRILELLLKLEKLLVEDKEYLDTVILLIGQWRQLQRDEIRGDISNKSKRKQSNRINKALMTLKDMLNEEGYNLFL